MKHVLFPRKGKWNLGENCLILHIFSQHCCNSSRYGGSISERLIHVVSKPVVLALYALNGTSIQPPPPPSLLIEHSNSFHLISILAQFCIFEDACIKLHPFLQAKTLIVEEYEKRKADSDSHSLSQDP